MRNTSNSTRIFPLALVGLIGATLAWFVFGSLNSSGAGLADTGADIGLGVLIGVGVLVLGGGAFLVVGLRRRKI